MKQKKPKPPTERELLAWCFGTEDLKKAFGTDDPIEILARVDEATIVNAGSGLEGFDEEEQEMRELVTRAKQTMAKREADRGAHLLGYLAEMLCKTSRQVREYCKDGLVPGAYQTKGGHWRVRYEPDTVKRTRVAIGESWRQRTENWLIDHLRKEWRKGLYLGFNEVAPWAHGFSRIGYECVQEAIRLQAKGERVSVKGVASKKGFSRTTVGKHLPHLGKAGTGALVHNNKAYDNIPETYKHNGKVRKIGVEADDDHADTEHADGTG